MLPSALGCSRVTGAGWRRVPPVAVPPFERFDDDVVDLADGYISISVRTQIVFAFSPAKTPRADIRPRNDAGSGWSPLARGVRSYRAGRGGDREYAPAFYAAAT
jgi:hypothetical protein